MEQGQFQLRIETDAFISDFWKQKIANIVFEEGSIWRDLSLNGYFDRLSLEASSAFDEHELLSKAVQEALLIRLRKMVDIPSGSFTMGALQRDKNAFERETIAQGTDSL